MVENKTEKLVYNVSEAAMLLGVSGPTLRNAIKHGDIPTLILGRRVLIPVVALNKLLESK